MPGGPYPNQVSSVSRYTTTGGTPCDVATCSPGTSPLLAYIPDSATAGTPMVWVLHGVASDYIEILTTTNFATTGCRDLLLDHGYIVLAPSTPAPPVDQNSWGNQAGRDQLTAVLGWARSIWPSTPGPYLYGISMGNMVGLNWLMEGLPVSAFYGNSGVCDLTVGWTINSADMQAAYGLSGAPEGPGTSGWLAKTAGHDPMVVPIDAFPRIPMRFVASYSDSTAHQEINTDAFMARCAAVPWPVELSLIEYVGAHTAPVSFKKQDIVDFFARSTPVYSNYDRYRLYMRGPTALRIPAEMFMLVGGALTSVPWSAGVPVAAPAEYTRPQP